jgi:PhoPQ-activated pathogenicity-related protein
MKRKETFILITLLCALTSVHASLWNQLITLIGQIQLDDIVLLYQYRTPGHQITDSIIKITNLAYSQTETFSFRLKPTILTTIR